MKRLFRLALLLAPFAGHAQETDTRREPVMCDVGPVTKQFGGTPWIVYSCSDNATLAIVSAPASPAAPFTFMFYFLPEKGAYQLHGQGTGNRQATDAAFAELSVMPATAIIALLQETRAADAASP